MSRIVALLSKEFADLRHNPGVFLPAVLTAIISIVLPFVVAVIVPAWTGERLSDSSDLQVAIEMLRTQPRCAASTPKAPSRRGSFSSSCRCWCSRRSPASMSVAAYTVIGEKQARTLEPLLATPITTFELLSAKVLGALVPALAPDVGLLRDLRSRNSRPGAIRASARSLLAPRSLGMVFLLGPLAALAALQLAVCVSSRVNDARSAQQIGALIILPLAGLLVGQLTGTVAVTGRVDRCDLAVRSRRLQRRA